MIDDDMDLVVVWDGVNRGDDSDCLCLPEADRIPVKRIGTPDDLSHLRRKADVESALRRHGASTLAQLSIRTGMTRSQVLDQLAKFRWQGRLASRPLDDASRRYFTSKDSDGQVQQVYWLIERES